MKFKNRGELSIKNKGDIRIKIKRQYQTIKNVLYILDISVNLLFIIALNRREFLISFRNRNIKIIDKRSN